MPRTLISGLLSMSLLFAACSSEPPVDAGTPASSLPGWSLGPEMPEAFGELATVALPADGDTEALVVLSGISSLGEVSDRVFIFDAGSEQWERGPDLPAPRHHSAAAALDGAVFVAGGAEEVLDQPWTGEDNLWRWRPGDDNWESLAPLPQGRWGHRMVVFERRLYVVGGHGEDDLEDQTFVYDPEQDAWNEVAPIPQARDHLSVVVADDRIWAIAGRNGGITSRVDIYDPRADAWSPGPPLPRATSGAAEASVDGRIFIFGGEEPDSAIGSLDPEAILELDIGSVAGGVIDEHWSLDTHSPPFQWESAPPPPLAVHGADGAVFAGSPVIVGGSTLQGTLSILAWTDAFQRLDND